MFGIFRHEWNDRVKIPILQIGIFTLSTLAYMPTWRLRAGFAAGAGRTAGMNRDDDAGDPGKTSSWAG
jgi:hypothetical protein